MSIKFLITILVTGLITVSCGEDKKITDPTLGSKEQVSDKSVDPNPVSKDEASNLKEKNQTKELKPEKPKAESKKENKIKKSTNEVPKQSPSKALEKKESKKTPSEEKKQEVSEKKSKEAIKIEIENLVKEINQKYNVKLQVDYFFVDYNNVKSLLLSLEDFLDQNARKKDQDKFLIFFLNKKIEIANILELRYSKTFLSASVFGRKSFEEQLEFLRKEFYKKEELKEQRNKLIETLKKNTERVNKEYGLKIEVDYSFVNLVYLERMLIELEDLASHPSEDEFVLEFLKSKISIGNHTTSIGLRYYGISAAEKNYILLEKQLEILRSGFNKTKELKELTKELNEKLGLKIKVNYNYVNLLQLEKMLVELEYLATQSSEDEFVLEFLKSKISIGNHTTIIGLRYYGISAAEKNYILLEEQLEILRSVFNKIKELKKLTKELNEKLRLKIEVKYGYVNLLQLERILITLEDLATQSSKDEFVTKFLKSKISISNHIAIYGGRFTISAKEKKYISLDKQIEILKSKQKL